MQKLFYFFIILTTLISCSKEKIEQINSASASEDYATYLKVSNGDLTNIKNLARQRHNSYHSSLYTACIADDMTSEADREDKIEYLREFSNTYFDTIYNSSKLTYIDTVIDGAIEHEDVSGWIDNQLELISNDTIISYFNLLIAFVDDGYTPSRFIDSTNALFNRELAKNHGDISNIPITLLTGIAQGSYKYWWENIDNWVGTITILPPARPEWINQVIQFVLADIGGGSTGAYYGGLVGGVGAGPGAIIGACIFSGGVALTW